VFPSGIYVHAIFPMSVTVAALLGGCCLLTAGPCDRPRMIGAGLLGALAAASYSMGILAAPVFAQLVLLRLGWRAWPRAAAVGGLVAAGTVAALVMLQVQVGALDQGVGTVPHLGRFRDGTGRFQERS
jgi:hypothetical protein